MDLNLTEEQEMLKKVARDFFINELPKSLVEELADGDKGFTPDLWKKITDLGWTGLIVPEEYGGFGGSFQDLIALLEETGRACMPGPFFSTAVLGALTIMEAGNKEQKQEILTRICSGDILLATALSEPKAVNSPKSFEVKAEPNEGGYIINGIKLFVPDAHVADYIICAARTGSDITLFLVDSKTEGVTWTLLPTISGDKQCEVNFSNVKVSAKDILGEVNQGWKYMQNVLQMATIARCAEMIGGAQKVLEITVEYAKVRVQFGKPIGAQQAVQHHCTNMAIDLKGCLYMTYYTAWMITQNKPCVKEVAMTKAWVNEAYQRITSLGHQVHGAIAWQKDHDRVSY